MTLVATLTSLLTRLKYSANLTKFTQEITSSLSEVTNKAGHMIRLDNGIGRATRECDAKRYQHIVASEREFNRHRMYKDVKEDYWTKQLEFAQEREVNSVHITRLDGVVGYCLGFPSLKNQTNEAVGQCDEEQGRQV
ncbi:hypothetical protein BS47DRAFT_1118901 [Hydnum rufescens UP504]|uniref:Uncharacterized protein n=1 Tax=Hydnum rufescens UP504 TaxID=1448309 RepID=A0A9P6ATZ9_9AGAM|nr:hypothetical protein BS47DRAFT_1118901 [Hydnum rufescens UP504]